MIMFHPNDIDDFREYAPYNCFGGAVTHGQSTNNLLSAPNRKEVRFAGNHFATHMPQLFASATMS
jgi:hypothetical protein